MISDFFSRLDQLGGLGIILFIIIFLLCLIVPFTIELFGGIGLYYVIYSIQNKYVRWAVTAILFVLAFPFMVVGYNVLTITDTEKKLAPFSYSLRAKSRAFIVSNFVYIFAIYYLFYR